MTLPFCKYGKAPKNVEKNLIKKIVYAMLGRRVEDRILIYRRQRYQHNKGVTDTQMTHGERLKTGSNIFEL